MGPDFIPDRGPESYQSAPAVVNSYVIILSQIFSMHLFSCSDYIVRLRFSNF